MKGLVELKKPRVRFYQNYVGVGGPTSMHICVRGSLRSYLRLTAHLGEMSDTAGCHLHSSVMRNHGAPESLYTWQRAAALAPMLGRDQWRAGVELWRGDEWSKTISCEDSCSRVKQGFKGVVKQLICSSDARRQGGQQTLVCSGSSGRLDLCHFYSAALSLVHSVGRVSSNHYCSWADLAGMVDGGHRLSRNDLRAEQFLFYFKINLL